VDISGRVVGMDARRRRRHVKSHDRAAVLLRAASARRLAHGGPTQPQETADEFAARANKPKLQASRPSSPPGAWVQLTYITSNRGARGEGRRTHQEAYARLVSESKAFDGKPISRERRAHDRAPEAQACRHRRRTTREALGASRDLDPDGLRRTARASTARRVRRAARNFEELAKTWRPAATTTRAPRHLGGWHSDRTPMRKDLRALRGARERRARAASATRTSVSCGDPATT
jgi:hypothetical protein